MRFKDKRVLITGAASGIGQAASLAFAAEGAHLALLDRNFTALQAVADEIRAMGCDALPIHCDLSETQAIHTAFDQLEQHWAQLDVACNNAGISGVPTPFWQVPESAFDDIVQINVKSVWVCMQRELKLMMAQGKGAIVNTASVAGLKGFPNYAAYSASKHAVVGLTKSVAFEVAPLGIRVNAVCPGMTETPMVNQVATEDVRRKILKSIPMGRMGKPEEIAKLMLFLCSDEASFTAGQPYVASGGAFT